MRLELPDAPGGSGTKNADMDDRFRDGVRTQGETDVVIDHCYESCKVVPDECLRSGTPVRDQHFGKWRTDANALAV